MFELDFSLLPGLARGGLFMGLPHDLEQRLRNLNLPETLDRLRGASRFIGEVSTTKEEWLNRAYLRAGLSEFRSVAQALYWDLGRREVYKPVESPNPLVHLLFRLRRLSVYVANLDTDKSSAEVIVRVSNKDHALETPILLVKDIERYVRLEELDKYRDNDIDRICQWFEENQRRFGASHVLDVGIMLYCDELCSFYSERKQAV